MQMHTLGFVAGGAGKVRAAYVNRKGRFSPMIPQLALN